MSNQIAKPSGFLASAIMSVLLLVSAELVLRLVFPDKIKKETEIAYTFHPDYLVSMKPNIEKRFPRSPSNGGDIIYWKTNKQGFRGAELQGNPGVRIIVYGDSNIQGRFSSLENTFARKLEKRLRSVWAKDVEVINAGVVGFGPDQSLIRLRLEADKYRPNLVIFHVFADNDFGDLIRNRLFELGDSGNLVRSKHETTVDEQLMTPNWLEQFISSLLLVRGAQKVVRKLLATVSRRSKESLTQTLLRTAQEEYSVYQAREARHYSHFADQYDIDLALFPGTDSAKTKTALMDKVLVEAKAVAEAKNIRFMVLIQPSAVDLTENSELNYSSLSEYPSYDRRRLASIAEDICSQRRIHNVNLFNVFLSNKPDTLFFEQDNNHWTDAGQDLAAEVTARYINYHMAM